MTLGIVEREIRNSICKIRIIGNIDRGLSYTVGHDIKRSVLFQLEWVCPTKL
jgi:hypothetical protein